MDRQQIERFIRESERFEMPDVQGRFSLSYSELNTLLEELQQDGTIEYSGGFSYRVIPGAKKKRATPVYQPKEWTEIFYIRALWYCIRSGAASAEQLRRRFSCDFATAASAISWMQSHKYIGPSPSRTIRITQEDFIDIFGEPESIITPEEHAAKCLADIRREVDKRCRELKELRRAAPGGGAPDDANDNDDGDDNDAMDDAEEDDEDDARAYIEKRRADLMARMLQLTDSACNEEDEEDGDDEDGDDEDGDDDNDYGEDNADDDDDGNDGNEDEDDNVNEDEGGFRHPDIGEIVLHCIRKCLTGKKGSNRYTVNLYDHSEFTFSYYAPNNALKITDSGRTLSKNRLSEQQVLVALKNHPDVELQDGILFTVVQYPHQLLTGLMRLYAAAAAVKRLR